MNRGQIFASRTSPKMAPSRRQSIILAKPRSRHVAMPIAATLVEVVVSHFFS
jgi:hypothetical protein